MTDIVHVLFCFSPSAGQVIEHPHIFPAGITIEAAWKELSHLFLGHHEPPIWGVWGRKVLPNYVLSEGDRLELYRPLRVDPKIARRQRFKKQGVKRSGLFANRRPGSAAGY